MEIDEKALESIIGKSIAKAMRAQEEVVTAAKLYEVASSLTTPFKSWGGGFYIDVEIRGSKETLSLPCDKIKAWLRHLYFKLTDGDLATDAMVERVLEHMRADAHFTSERHEVFTRVGYKDGAIYIDMAHHTPKFIKVTAEGWNIVNEVPVKFVRSEDVLPLPQPEAPGATLLALLTPFLSVQKEEEAALLMGYLMGLVLPKGPYPVLVITGEHGAAKSTTVRLLRNIIDPHNLDMRAPFADTRDMVAAVRNSYVLAFDNVSYVANWLSDALCALATGTRAVGGRALYTNSDEAAFRAMRPIMCNGIPDFVRKPDLVDRIIKVDLRRIRVYRSDEEYWDEFKQWHPKILGALCDCMVEALRNRASVEVPPQLRMPHFSRWAEAGLQKAGFNKGVFIKALSENKLDANEAILEFSPMGLAIRKMLDYMPLDEKRKQKRFYGTYAELRAELVQFCVDAKHLPEKMQGIASELRALTPSLNSAGIVVQFHGRNDAGARRNLSIVEITRNASE